jgi:hypothetical protein
MVWVVSSGNAGGFARHFVHRKPIPAEHFLVIHAVNGAKRENLVNCGNCPFIFNVRKAAQGNGEFLRAKPDGKFMACLLYVPKRQAQAFADSLQLLPFPLHAMILAMLLTAQRPEIGPYISIRPEKCPLLF